MAAINTWLNGVIEFKQTVGKTLAAAQPAIEVWAANDLATLVSGTQPGEYVPGTSLTPAKIGELVELWAALETFLDTPLAVSGKTPRALIYRVEE